MGNLAKTWALMIGISLIISTYCVPKISSQNLDFKHYSAEQGLSQSVVNCLFQDKLGFIWIGTQNGLNRYDGYRFETYTNNPSDTTSISNSWIYSITQDTLGNIYAGTKNGLNKLNRLTGKFERINYKSTVAAKFQNNSVYGLSTATDGSILINAAPFLCIYNPYNQSVKVLESPLEPDAFIHDQHIPVIQAKDGIIWFGSNKGLASYNPKTSSFAVFNAETNFPYAISNNRVSALIEDKTGNIWVGTANGLNKINPKKKGIESYISITDSVNSLDKSFIRAIVQDNKNSLWIATEQGGLIQMLKPNSEAYSFRSYTKENSGLSSNNVLSLLIDYSNNLWVGTLNRLNKTDLKEKKFRLYRNDNSQNSVNLLGNIIASIYKARDGKIWVGNWGQGLNIYDRKTNHVVHYTAESTGNYSIANNFVHTIFEDNRQQIWIGTRNGIQIFDNEKAKFINYYEKLNADKLPKFENSRINCIIQDKEGIIWVATQEGLYSLNIEKNTFDRFSSESSGANKITGNLVYVVREDSEGLIWIGTSAGLNCYYPTDKKMTQFLHNPNNPNSLATNFVVSVAEDFEGNIWIGTESYVNKYNKKSNTFTYYNKDYGLPGNLIYEILEDKKQNLWFATGNGLSVFNRETNSFKTYSVDEGLQSNEFNLRACYNSPDGELFFGGMNGFNSYYPDSIRHNTYIPPIVIMYVEKTLDGVKQIINTEFNKTITLDYNEYVFSVWFAALDFTKSEKNQYSYKLDGLMNDWLEIGTRNYIPFSNVPPGKYTLRVRGSNNDGLWNETGDAIQIIILPPWWKSNLAYSMYIILLIAGIASFIKLRERRLVYERNVLENRVKERTEEIALQKEKIEKAHKEITDSINYASRIQNAILPQANAFSEVFADSFIIYQPKDVVSGDFYWIDTSKEEYLFAVADCTGHGVPGAILSMLGISLLTEITNLQHVNTPNEVLELLRSHIKNTLKQNDDSISTKDGMDIAFCVYNPKTSKLQYSGANSSVFIIRNSKTKPELEEYKPTRNPIGIYHAEIPFAAQTIDINSGDLLYLFSDGLIDQFNERNEKFKRIRFKKLLLEIADHPMHEQKRIITETFKLWKGKHVQIDDLVVIGIRF